MFSKGIGRETSHLCPFVSLALNRPARKVPFFFLLHACLLLFKARGLSQRPRGPTILDSAFGLGPAIAGESAWPRAFLVSE